MRDNAVELAAGTGRPSLVRAVATAVRKPLGLLGGVPSRAPLVIRLAAVGVGLAVLLVVQLLQAGVASVRATWFRRSIRSPTER